METGKGDKSTVGWAGNEAEHSKWNKDEHHQQRHLHLKENIQRDKSVPLRRPIQLLLHTSVWTQQKFSSQSLKVVEMKADNAETVLVQWHVGGCDFLHKMLWGPSGWSRYRNQSTGSYLSEEGLFVGYFILQLVIEVVDGRGLPLCRQVAFLQRGDPFLHVFLLSHRLQPHRDGHSSLRLSLRRGIDERSPRTSLRSRCSRVFMSSDLIRSLRAVSRSSSSSPMRDTMAAMRSFIWPRSAVCRSTTSWSSLTFPNPGSDSSSWFCEPSEARCKAHTNTHTDVGTAVGNDGQVNDPKGLNL